VVDSAVGTTAAVVVVAAEESPAGPARSVTTAPAHEAHEPHRPQLADGTKPGIAAAPQAERPVRMAEGTQPGAPVYRPTIDPELAARATGLGETWAQDYVRDLRAQSRDIVGGWPGTLREARRRVLATMPRNIDPLLLDELARITNLAARRGWESVSAPDLEP
jgi:hypothetical protein